MRKFRPFLGGLLAALLVAGVSGEAISQTTQQTSYRNLLVNGEATLNNPGTATLTGLNTTATYATDGFAVYSNNAGASVVAGRSTANLPTGFTAAFSLNRTAANANLTQACMVQVVETSRLLPFAGQNLVLTGYLAAGATFSAAGGAAQITVTSGTGTDQGLTGLLAATWTGQTNIVASQSTGAIGAAFSRVGVVFNLPATATELAVQFCFTPVGTAGATDTLFLTGAQLEVANTAPGQGQCPAIPVGAAPTTFTQASVTCGTSYEHKPIEAEISLAQRYFFQAAEVNTVMYKCTNTGANVQTCSVPLPVQMRAAPTASITAGGLQMIIDSAAGTPVVTPTGGTGTPNVCNFNFANTASAAVHTVDLRGSLTTGLLACSARL